MQQTVSHSKQHAKAKLFTYLTDAELVDAVCTWFLCLTPSAGAISLCSCTTGLCSADIACDDVECAAAGLVTDSASGNASLLTDGCAGDP